MTCGLHGLSSGPSTAEQASLEVLAAMPALESVRMSDVMHEAGVFAKQIAYVDCFM